MNNDVLCMIHVFLQELQTSLYELVFRVTQQGRKLLRTGLVGFRIEVGLRDAVHNYNSGLLMLFQSSGSWWVLWVGYNKKEK